MFVPAMTLTTEEGPRAEHFDVDAWLDQVYSDSTLVVQRRQTPGGGHDSLPTSSSTMPSLMIQMLEALDVHDGHRVLEIGTGTGYNAALLAHRLGSDNVTSIDIDPDLVKAARQRLEELGHRPRLVAGDGLTGVPNHGPYDRIIATCAVPEIPLAWIEQLTPGGAMVVNVRGHLVGVLCVLVKQDDNEVIGPVIGAGSDFMWLRQDLSSPLRTAESPVRIGARKVARNLTALPPADVENNRDLAWLLQLSIPGLRMICSTDVFDPIEKRSRPGLLLYAEDGSHAQAVSEPEKDGQHRVIQGGPRRLWDTVETTHTMWTRLANPAPRRFGVVANQTVQFVWLDNDMDWLRWPLPLVWS
ncbi:MAG TPA: methyltransferase domain-containing protein [Pseudonocardiaceae bacterium]|nr:methyltransferase domain-containing protein [Pseudonocardiaceae bacterium]